jgi:hypothetical protein
MSSDASQSILRMTLLAGATAALMAVWNGDSSRTVGMTLTERNRQVFPAHAVHSGVPRTQLAVRVPQTSKCPPAVASMKPATSEAPAGSFPRDVETLPAGSYRVVFDDGRVEWLTIIDRQRGDANSRPAVLSTTLNGEHAHIIRVSSRGEGSPRM